MSDLQINRREDACTSSAIKDHYFVKHCWALIKLSLETEIILLWVFLRSQSSYPLNIRYINSFQYFSLHMKISLLKLYIWVAYWRLREGKLNNKDQANTGVPSRPLCPRNTRESLTNSRSADRSPEWISSGRRRCSQAQSFPRPALCTPAPSPACLSKVLPELLGNLEYTKVCRQKYTKQHVTQHDSRRGDNTQQRHQYVNT